MKHGDYELLSAREMSRKYGLTAENRPVIALNAANVPEELRALLPPAEFWGIGDDVIRLMCCATRQPKRWPN